MIVDGRKRTRRRRRRRRRRRSKSLGDARFMRTLQTRAILYSTVEARMKRAPLQTNGIRAMVLYTYRMLRRSRPFITRRFAMAGIIVRRSSPLMKLFELHPRAWRTLCTCPILHAGIPLKEITIRQILSQQSAFFYTRCLEGRQHRELLCKFIDDGLAAIANTLMVFVFCALCSFFFWRVHNFE